MTNTNQFMILMMKKKIQDTVKVDLPLSFSLLLTPPVAFSILPFKHKTDFVVNNHISTRMTYEKEYPVLGNCNGTSSLIVLDYLKKTWKCLLIQMSPDKEDLL